jgi:hypothetical protein
MQFNHLLFHRSLGLAALLLGAVQTAAAQAALPFIPRATNWPVSTSRLSIHTVFNSIFHYSYNFKLTITIIFIYPFFSFIKPSNSSHSPSLILNIPLPPQ